VQQPCDSQLRDLIGPGAEFDGRRNDLVALSAFGPLVQ
jgi:hypothetical protein